MMKKKGQLRWLPGLCTGASGNNVRARTPPPKKQQQYRLTQNSVFADEFSNGNSSSSSSNGSGVMDFNNGCKLKQQEDGGNNKVVLVVDPSLDANGALQWVFSHTVQAGDTLLLLHVVKSSATESKRQRAYQLLCSMKQKCQIRKPEVDVEIMIVEGDDKGKSIVEEVKYQKASLLVLGQRMQTMASRFRKIWSVVKRRTTRSRRGRVVEYCIQNANCLAIAVRKKKTSNSRKHGGEGGGYLITTKRHKNFWLLA
ncbi:uncharacterized protein LOC124929413 [Impatiens glandulifera]|uniref:uncharacterized protein LOC124929413 n=1 Tax=Impatiens glandulifera TaxID=253017 RepID=UPI001FB09D41|nr:uncharacterized protein LOC124929413 [Impatiens glandulifera]